ncbi:glycoside hydrolase family 16 protein [Mycena rebaudengoi]|nr:glycoside hydrolase family 16 protein [Mycena rebaudengoi]
MHTLAVLLLPFFAFFLSAEAQICNATSLCPSAAPCCSEFGYCGTGNEFCLAGCNPFQSHTLDSCKPGPICKSKTYTFKDGSRILTNSTTQYGDPNKYDWVVDGGAVSVANGELSMLLTETNDGVRLSSTRYIHYGTITTTMKTGRWKGVIDWEFPGAATTQGQTNYFWQGLVTTPNHGGVSKGLSDTYSNYHDYTYSKLTIRSCGPFRRVDTIVDGVTRFPNTPSRIQFSASAPGTINWAGGMVNWRDKDYTAAGGHFTARVKSVAVKCGDPTPPGASVQGYVYSGGTLSNPRIAFTNDSPVAGSGLPVPVVPRPSLSSVSVEGAATSASASGSGFLSLPSCRHGVSSASSASASASKTPNAAARAVKTKVYGGLAALFVGLGLF